MAKKNNAKPMPLAVMIIISLIAIALAAAFLAYLLDTNTQDGDTESIDTSYEQSFADESSLEPPPEEVIVKETMADASVGDAVVFGTYEQNGNTADGAEKMEWIVLEKQDDKLLLISRKCLDTKPINETRSDVEWNQSTLFAWLNGEFAQNAFSETELASLIEADGVKVTVPSAEEAKKYYEYDSWRTAEATEQAIKNGARVQNGKTWWWLLDKGEIASSNSYVYFNGTIRTDGLSVDYQSVAVRPMMWVSSSAETETEHLSRPEASEDASEDASVSESESTEE
ncbi:MAG: hypothetical protein IIX67_05395 [Clostridia bacterium]|nr:hypothetical protein [Clostridia bacterium]